MSRYVFSGEIVQGRQTQPFSREIEGESEPHARDKLLSALSSEHSVKRSKIEISEVEEE